MLQDNGILLFQEMKQLSIEYPTNFKNHRLFNATKEFVVFASNVLGKNYEIDITKIKEERPVLGILLILSSVIDLLLKLMVGFMTLNTSKRLIESAREP
jgi:hypothetical protein